MEVDGGPNLRNAKDGGPIAAEGAKRPRDNEKGPRRQSHRDCGYGGKPP